jgi:serine/threonine-protein kinase HipA
MEFSNIIALFFGGMDKLSPGDDRFTREMFRRLPQQSYPVIVDAGCGSGRQTLALAGESGMLVHAIDTHMPFLEHLERRARAMGLDHLVSTRCMDMKDIPVEFPHIDLLWSEGAAYSIGFANALVTWAPAIVPGGYAVVSEMVWLKDDVPGDVRSFFDSEYPDMRTVEEILTLAREAGYTVLHTEVLPAWTWVDGYYDTFGPRAQALLDHPDADVRAFARQAVEEVRIFNKSEGSYGYVFFVLQK